MTSWNWLSLKVMDNKELTTVKNNSTFMAFKEEMINPSSLKTPIDSLR